MPRGYRSIIFALVGWVALTGQHPNPSTKNEQASADHRVGDALTNIAATYDKQTKDAERSPESRECRPGDDHRDSDLCAQWKAADAAADAAFWAEWGTWVGGLSGLLVVAALGLAFQSNRIARETANRQLRAYVHVTKYEIDERNREYPMTYIRFENCGQTPAFNVTSNSNVMLVDLSKDFAIPPITVEQRATRTIGPGCALAIGPTWGGKPRPTIIMPQEALCVYGVITYDDAFGAVHKTHFCYTGVGIIGQAFKFTVHPEHNDSD